MKEYAVIYERGPNNWSAYVPDLPGCISMGKTRTDIERNIQEAIELHIEGMLADGEPIPEPSSTNKINPDEACDVSVSGASFGTIF